MKTQFKRLSGLVALSFALVAPVSALTLTINEGLGGARGGMVGSIDPGTPANLASEVVYVNNLLGLGANAVGVIDGNTYDTTAFNFSGTVSAVGALDYPDNPPGTIPGGYEYVLGKFGSRSLVWYLGGESFEIASLPGTGNGLSHWAAFNRVPVVPDGGSTIALLGLGLALLAIARRKLA